MADTHQHGTIAGTASQSVAIVANGCVLKGEIILAGSIHINGKVQGDITTPAQVLIGANGHVQGKVHAKHLIIKGSLQGEVISELFEALRGCTVEGSIISDVMICEMGSKVNLVVQMEKNKYVQKHKTNQIFRSDE